jgi:hypothetical protein
MRRVLASITTVLWIMALLAPQIGAQKSDSHNSTSNHRSVKSHKSVRNKRPVDHRSSKSVDGKTLSNNRHYTNSAGHSVHSPARTKDGTIPAGATALCRDGTYSFSQSRRGTCSHHGGVERWLR